jgi:tetratricopeptide (TPR) repeat protein
MRHKKMLCVFIMLFSCLTLLKAEVSLEEVIQAGRFVFYRDHADPHKYYYVPDEPRLATKRDGTPEFTFIKYTKTGGDIKGGIVHFLVTWGLTESEIFSAETSLQMIDPEAKVVGPVPFKEGTFQIISATAGEGGLFNVKICGEGKAPIMPGQKGAVSIALTQEGASLLWESFKNPTSDISVMFMLKYDGITPAYEAKLKVDWDKVYTHHDVSLSGGGVISNVIKLEAEIKAIFDELRQKGAIQLEVTGESQDMEKLLEVTYGHLIKLMCNTEIRTDDQISKSKSTTTRRPTRTIKKKENGGENFPVFSRSWSPSSLGSLGGQRYPFLTPETLFAGLGSPWAFGDIAPAQEQQRADTGDQRAEALKQEAKGFEERGEYTKAIEKYIESYSSSSDPELLYLIARLYDEHLQDPKNAAGQYRRYLEEGRKRNAFQGRGDRENSVQERIQRLEESVEHTNRGTELASQSSYSEALQAFEQSQEVAPNYRNLEYMASCLENLHERARSVESYRRLLDYIKKYPEQFSEVDIDRRIEKKINDLESGTGSQSQTGDQTRSLGDEQTEERSQAAQQDKTVGTQEKAQEQKTESTSGQTKQEGKSQASSSGTQSQTQTRTQRRPARKTPATTKKPTVSKSKPPVKPPFNLKVAYTFKRVKMSGHYEVDLRQRVREERVMVMSGNIAGVYQQFGEDKRFFSTVSLDDPVFQERTIEVILDGQDFEDFKDYINNVSVLFKKERWGKPATTGDVKFFDEQFAENGNRLTFIYGREGEGSTEWLNYEYKPKWSFHGGIEWEGDWVKTSDSVVTLSPVVEYRTVEISMDKDNIEENGIKAAAFQIKHQIFGKDILREVIIDYERGDPLQAEYRYLHEEGKLGYQYKIIWLLKDGREIHSDWMTKETPIIYAFYQEQN